MRFYNQQHKYYCGVDLHARKMYVCIIYQKGKTKNDKIDSLNQIRKKLEWHIEKTARQHDYHSLFLLRSIPGVGQILALI